MYSDVCASTSCAKYTESTVWCKRKSYVFRIFSVLFWCRFFICHFFCVVVVVVVITGGDGSEAGGYGSLYSSVCEKRLLEMISVL